VTLSEDDGTELAWVRGELSEIRRELLPAGESRELYLALDQGGSSSRAVLFDAVGREVASGQVPIATRRSADDRVEHDPEELVQSLLTAARDALDSPAVGGRPVAAAGLATQRSTIVCWDRHTGEALSPAISWQDRRNAAWLERHLGSRAAWVRDVTGLPLSAHYGASKLRWCLDELAAVRLALRDERLAAGPLASFLLHRLCDERPVVVDPANASRTLLYDPATLDWSAPLMQAFGISPDILPRCVGTQHAFGTLRATTELAVPLRACSGDQSAALYAFGTPSPATAFVNVGTGAFVQRVLQGGSAKPASGLLQSVVRADTDSAANVTCSHEGTVNGAGSAVEWLARDTGLDLARALDSLDHAVFTESVTLLFMNGVGGLGAPYWRPDFPVEFVPLPGTVQSSSAELMQLAAVLESIAFLIAVQVELMQQSGPLQRLVVTGGLAACDYLCQALADACVLPVARPALREATARGTAYLATHSAVAWQPVPIERSFAASGSQVVARRRRLWRAAMEARLNG
jgi:glycerol kinase